MFKYFALLLVISRAGGKYTAQAPHDYGMSAGEILATLITSPKASSGIAFALDCLRPIVAQRGKRRFTMRAFSRLR